MGRKVVSRSLTRRQVLRGVAVGIGVLIGSSAIPLLEGLAGRVAFTPDLTRAAFARVVGGRFNVDVTHARTTTIQLLSVRSLAADGRPPTGEGFSLLFTGTLAEKFPQDTYTVDHSSMGRFAMFLVPVGPAGPDQRYEAVFNRLWN